MHDPYNGPEHDFPPYDGPVRSYVLCSVPRCGSTFLARMLWQTGLLGFPKEYFNTKTQVQDWHARFGPVPLGELAERLKRCRTSPNGVFGFKGHFLHFAELMGSVKLEAVFPGLRYIVIERRDLVRQALSYHRAIQTGAFSTDMAVQAEPKLDYKTLEHAFNAIMHQSFGWRRYLALRGIEPLRIVYEDLVSDPAAQVYRVLDHMGIADRPPVDPDRGNVKVQRDALTEEWVAALRQMADRQAGIGTG